jgi:Tfp pilus assembly protein PilF
LAYNYGDQAFKLLQKHDLAGARKAGETSVRYAPNSADSHSTLGFLSYAAGDKQTALAEFKKAQSLDPDFRKQWESEASFFKQFSGILTDQDFRKQLFPEQ